MSIYLRLKLSEKRRETMEWFNSCFLKLKCGRIVLLPVISKEWQYYNENGCQCGTFYAATNQIPKHNKPALYYNADTRVTVRRDEIAHNVLYH